MQTWCCRILCLQAGEYIEVDPMLAEALNQEGLIFQTVVNINLLPL